MRFLLCSLALITATTAGCKKDSTAGTSPDVQSPSPPAAAETTETKPVVKGETAMNSDPVNLPAAGTAPPPVEVGTDFAKVWEAPIKTLSGKPTHLSEYKGKALLLVNVASKCGLTPQYATLEALQDKYAAKGFTVVGFPCNQFGGQEPGSAEEIQTFCSTKYGVSFPLTEKIEVNGAGKHPIYDVLTKIPDATGRKGDIQWNFEKFVVSADGKKVTRFAPPVKPDDPAVIAAIENALPR